MSLTEKISLVQNLEELGALLQEHRIQKKMSLEEVAAISKIQLRKLNALESGYAGELSHLAIAKGFIKTYCQILELDGDLVSNHFARVYPLPTANSNTSSSQISKSTDRPLTSDSTVAAKKTGSFMASPATRDLEREEMTVLQPRKIAILMGIIAGLALIAVLYFLGRKMHANSTTDSNPAPAANELTPPLPGAEDSPMEEAAETTDQPPDKATDKTTDKTTGPNAQNQARKEGAPQDPTPVPTPPPAAQRYVNVIALEEVWVNVRTDGSVKSSWVKVESGQERSFGFQNKVDLFLTDAGGIEILFQGKRYVSPGLRGTQTKLTFPDDVKKLKLKAAAQRPQPASTTTPAPGTGTPAAPSSDVESSLLE